MISNRSTLQLIRLTTKKHFQTVNIHCIQYIFFVIYQRVEDFISYIRTEKRSNVEYLEMPNRKIKKKIGTFLFYSFPFSIVLPNAGVDVLCPDLEYVLALQPDVNSNLYLA